MSERIASFGNGYSKTQIISENNSINYRLSFSAGSRFSEPAGMFFYFQNKPSGVQTDSPGLNIREWNPISNTIVDIKRFELTANSGPGNSAFITYINSIKTSANVFIITSGDRLYSSPDVDTLMSSLGSTLWPRTWMCNNYPCSYTGLLHPSKGMVTENFVTSDGVLRAEDIRPALDIVYDIKDDIGGTGFIKPSIYDMETYSSTPTNNMAKRYPVNNENSSPLATYNLKPNDNLMWSFKMLAPAGLGPQAANARILWYNGTSFIKSESIDSVVQDNGFWIPHQKYITVPSNATAFTITVQRAAGENTALQVSVSEMMLIRLSKTMTEFRGASISVNGVRMNSASDNGIPDDDLLIILFGPQGDIASAEFREYLD